MLENEIIDHLKRFEISKKLDLKSANILYLNIIQSIVDSLDEVRNDYNQTESYKDFLNLINRLENTVRDYRKYAFDGEIDLFE